jgi:hypothetical protein
MLSQSGDGALQGRLRRRNVVKLSGFEYNEVRRLTLQISVMFGGNYVATIALMCCPSYPLNGLSKLQCLLNTTRD